MMEQIYGVFWGTFDPPTLAHTSILSQALEHSPITHLLIIINNCGHKPYLASAEARKEMLEIATSGLNVPTEILIQSGELTYQALKKTYKSPLYALVGSDSFETFLEKSPEKLQEYDKIIVATRRKFKNDQDYQNVTFLTLDTPLQNISSSALRILLQNTLKCPEGLDERVFSYIKQHSLYKSFENGL